jgi:hypothetical protein
MVKPSVAIAADTPMMRKIISKQFIFVQRRRLNQID